MTGVSSFRFHVSGSNRQSLIADRLLAFPLLLFIVCMLAFALRVIHLSGQSLWYDEGFSVWLAGQSLGEITARTAADIQPPFYYYLLHCWMGVAGRSEFAVRFLSLIFGVLTVPLMAVVGRRLLGRPAGLIAALLAAISPFYVWYSQETRMYTLVTFLGLLGSYLLWRWLEAVRSGVTCVNLRSQRLEIAPGEPAAGRPPARTGASTQVDVRLEAPEVRLESLKLTHIRSGVLASSVCRLSSLILHPSSLILIGYFLVNLVAVYTHYYAFFLLAFQAVFALLYIGIKNVSERRERQPLAPHSSAALSAAHPLIRSLSVALSAAPILLIQVAIVLAYLPWAGVVFARYTLDESAWEGTLTLDALRHTLLMFATGHTVYEAQAQFIAIAYLALAVVGFLSLAASGIREQGANFARLEAGIQNPKSKIPSLLFLALYLLTPILLLYLISYNRPKFHPRYLMIASPAFFFLIAQGVVAWFNPQSHKLQSHKPKSPNIQYRVSNIWFAVTVGFLLATSIFALAPIYQNRVQVRDDWRGVVRLLNRQAKPTDAIILSSGHAFPVFDYYYPAGATIRLPDEPTLTTRRPLTYAIADTLNQATAGKEGVWLILWQHDIVDPANILLRLLDENARRVTLKPTYWGLEVRYYQLTGPVHFSTEPVITQPTHVRFVQTTAGATQPQITALGATLPPGSFPAGHPLPLTLFWQADAALTADYHISLKLTDASGHTWGDFDGRPAGYTFPTFRWPAGPVWPGDAPLVPVPGTPAGDYTLMATLYDAATGQPLTPLDAAGQPLPLPVPLATVRVVP